MHTNLDYLIMGVLMDDDKTGYDIKRVFEDSPASSVALSYGSIYPAIKKLEKEGVLERRLVIQDKKPNKQLLSLTSKGREIFLQWLRRPIDPSEFSVAGDPFSAKFLFFSYLNTNEVITHCLIQREATEKALDSITAFILQSETCLDRFALWNLRGTLVFLNARKTWLDEILIELGKEGKK